MRFASLILLALCTPPVSGQDAVDDATIKISPAEATGRAIAAMRRSTSGEIDAAVRTMQAVGRFQSHSEAHDGALARVSEGQYVAIYAQGRFRIDFDAVGHPHFVEIPRNEAPAGGRDELIDDRFTILFDGDKYRLFSHIHGPWERECQTLHSACHKVGFPFRNPLFLGAELVASIKWLQRDDLLVKPTEQGFVASFSEDTVTNSATINSTAGFHVSQLEARDPASFRETLNCTWAEAGGFWYVQRLERRLQVATKNRKDLETANCTILSLQTNVEIEDSLFLKAALSTPLEPISRSPLPSESTAANEP